MSDRNSWKTSNYGYLGWDVIFAFMSLKIGIV